jgi:hypothetical protein
MKKPAHRPNGIDIIAKQPLFVCLARRVGDIHDDLGVILALALNSCGYFPFRAARSIRVHW